MRAHCPSFREGHALLCTALGAQVILKVALILSSVCSALRAHDTCHYLRHRAQCSCMSPWRFSCAIYHMSGPSAVLEGAREGSDATASLHSARCPGLRHGAAQWIDRQEGIVRSTLGRSLGRCQRMQGGGGHRLAISIVSHHVLVLYPCLKHIYMHVH